MIVQGTEKTICGVTSTHAMGIGAGAADIPESTLPCAKATTAQSSLSGIAPPCIQACSGVQISATAMTSHRARDNPPQATNRRCRVRRFKSGAAGRIPIKFISNSRTKPAGVPRQTGGSLLES